MYVHSNTLIVCVCVVCVYTFMLIYKLYNGSNTANRKESCCFPGKRSQEDTVAEKSSNGKMW